jgi:3-dehydroquinate synthase II
VRERVVIRPTGEREGEREAVRARARARGFRSFVLRPDEAGKEGDADAFTLVDDRGAFRSPEGPPVPVLQVASEEALAAAVRGTPDGGTLAVEWAGDRVIPLENAIAARGRRFHLWSVARRPTEVPGALGALEHGADLVIVDVGSPSEVDELEALVEGPLPTGLEWAALPVRAVGPAGVGDRVIVDTTSLLRPDEGLLVGSAAAFLFHVASEAEGSRFSRPRPFRVNAGAAHSYVLLADGSTRYLSELGPGDSVLVTTPNAAARSARVGRVKLERRPMMLLSVDDRGTARTLFAQEAESVRVTTESGRRATTEVRPGSSLWGVRLPAARHLGRAVEEAIEER